jgi:AraC-like DNA-binding protein
LNLLFCARFKGEAEYVGVEAEHVNKRQRDGIDPKSGIAEIRTLGRRIATHAPSAGEHSTAISGRLLFRRTKPTACYRAAYEPSLTVFVQGRKRINLGGTEYLCSAGQFLLSSIDVPVESQIVEASEEVPLLSMLLRLEMSIVREILSRGDLPEPAGSSQRRGVAVGHATPGLLQACDRLIELLDTPEDVPFLSHLIQREIIYRVLRTAQGSQLRAIATTGDLGNRTARAISWLKTNYAKPLHMDELAEVARMGVSTLHHQFRALTTMSPLQYQKQLRLQTARQRMLMDGMDASSVQKLWSCSKTSGFLHPYIYRYTARVPRDRFLAFEGEGMTWMRQPSWQGIALFSVRMEFWRSTGCGAGRNAQARLCCGPRLAELMNL